LDIGMIYFFLPDGESSMVLPGPSASNPTFPPKPSGHQLEIFIVFNVNAETPPLPGDVSE
jgi:hypothetical protein